MAANVWLFWPNIIGYVRIALLAAAFSKFDNEIVFLICYNAAVALDWLDGFVARRFGQVSAFGAWFDVVIDNCGRSLLWIWLMPRTGSLIVILEWLTFACTHNLGAKWKEDTSTAPWWFKAVMANGFKTLPGVLTIAGLHYLPIWLYATHRGAVVLPDIAAQAIVLLLAAGRVLSACCEVWCIARHMTWLAALHEE